MPNRRWNRHKGGRPKGRQREQKPSFHILCEGVNTEPEYFKVFPVQNIGHCRGYGQSRMALVKTAMKYKRANQITKKSKDQIWVVFDYDYKGDLQPQQKEDFNNAIIKAESNGIRWAVSNDSFELWYVLHYQNCDAQQLRTWYNQRLEHHSGIGDTKERVNAKKMYDLLLPNQGDAIARAEAIVGIYDDNDKAYADKNPYTTVHELVKELNKYIK